MSAPTKTPKFPTPRAAANSGASDVTRAVRAGIECDDASGCVVPPLHLTSTFAFRAFGEKRTYDYTRSGNPTRDLLGQALAELEHGAGAVVTASGMAAVTVTGYLVPASGRIIVPHDCYGGTYRLFDAWRRRGERQVEFVDFGDAAALAAALARPAALLWIETPSNPLLRITDIAACAQAARAAGAITVVDNTFLSPAWQQPLTLGADLVVHSTTKYINGHSDVVGGAVIAREPALLEQLTWWANCLGLTGAPFDSFMTLRGLRTLRAPRAPRPQCPGARPMAERAGGGAARVVPGIARASRARARAASAERLRGGRHAGARGWRGGGARVRGRPRVLLAGRVARWGREPRGSPGEHDACRHGACRTRARRSHRWARAALDRHRGTGGLTQ
jgi:cystathionine gamma-synthase